MTPEYQRLKQLMLDQHMLYMESDDLDVGFKLGHYNDETEEVCLYDVTNDEPTITRLFALLMEHSLSWMVCRESPYESHTNIILRFPSVANRQRPAND